jgi:DNA repair protein RecO (recombination protein O)
MQWNDEGIVLGAKRHGEGNAILELMTRAHGRHLGLVRGGSASRLKPILQPGNSVSVSWRARLDEHLGNYSVEPLTLRAASFFSSPHAIYGIGHLAALMRLLPERDPHSRLYESLDAIFGRLDDAAISAPMIVRFELQLLSELGFGLDLERCVATGVSGDLVYVSPKSGRAVSRVAGEPWADKMLRLPAFLRTLETPLSGSDLADGFALTGYFLSRYVLEPRGITLGDERAHFIAALNRALRSVA